MLSSAASADVVQVGAGSYRTTRPGPCKALPEKIYKTADLDDHVPSGQWWSSLVWEPLSSWMFPHPLAVRCREGGLAVVYPGSGIAANKVGIFGRGGGKLGDFTIGHSEVESFSQANCGGYSDWFVTAAFARGKAALRVSFGHGSPFVYCRIAGGNPTLRFARKPRVWSGEAGDAVLGVSLHGAHYGLFGPTGSSWNGVDGTLFVNDADGKGYLSVALLPDDSPQTLAVFRKYAHNHVTDTRADFAVAGGVVKTTYRFEVEAREGEGNAALFSLYPHQWKYTPEKLSRFEYKSVRGAMKILAGRGFRTAVPVQGVLPLLPPQGIADRDRVLAYLQAEADKKPAGFGDTYWEGKHLGKLASLSGVAEAAGASDLQRVFIDELARRLEAWFTATPTKDQPVFYYDAKWSTLVGSRPSYGSDDLLNDHQFHYGYFIRAAAEVARVRPAWARRWGPMVELLIRNIAAPDRRDKLFPHLRCFDEYAGHSWASGTAKFGDGNNQESSSESMNAWYAMILWGAATGDEEVRDAGVFLYNTERTGVEEYWFDVSDTNYPDGFPHVALGMVWGGKGVFETWFSPDVDCIHGINWLPFTPGSLFMGRHPEYVKKNHASLVSARKGGEDYNNGWGDLVCMFGALENADRAAAYIDSTPRCKVEAGNTHSFMYHWIHTLRALGHVDASVTADHPLAVAFTKSGKRTYAAYNTGEKALAVKFSDGTRIKAKPRALTVER